MDKLRAMETFVAIVDRGSLTAAAESLDRSLPAVVRVLAELEEALGARLLQRSTRRMALTDEGRDYLERCRRILADVAEAEAVAAGETGLQRGTVRITAPVQFGRLHVLPLVIALTRAHPGINAELLFVDRVVDLLEEGMDVGVRIASLPDSSLIAHPVGQLRRLVCASPAYLAERGVPSHPRALADHACLLGTHLEIDAWRFAEDGREYDVTVRGPLRCNQVAARLDACVEGLGIGRFLSYQVERALAAGQLVPLLEAFEMPRVPVSLVVPSARLLPARSRLVLQWLRERLPQRVTPAVV
jgi:DNA-binding transcriptional LysR family regulator